jgi:acyl carrier protein
MDNIIEFTKKFQNQYFDTDTFELTPDTDFRQIDSWDSLTGMAVLVMIKDDYGVDITAETFKTLKTVKDVYSLIESARQ